jgi:hypothetical protein
MARTPGADRPLLTTFDRRTRTGRALLTATGIALAAPLGVGLLAAVATAGGANAHDNLLTATATCQTDGTYAVTWTVANDYHLSDTVSVVSATGTAPTFTPGVIAASTGTPYQTATAVQTLPGTTTSATLLISGTWSDGYTRTDTNTIALDGTCAAPAVVTPAAGTPSSTAPSSVTSSSVAPTGATTASAPTACAADAPLTDVSYLIDGVSEPTLAGYARQGDTVVAQFTVAAGCTQTLSLATYESPDSHYVAADNPLEKYVGADTETFGPGAHTLTMTLPDCDFQLDFVYGQPLVSLTPDAYHDAGTFIDGNNAGGTRCTDLTPTTSPSPSISPSISPSTPSSSPTGTATSTPTSTPTSTDPSSSSTPPAASTSTSTSSTSPVATATTTNTPGSKVLGETFNRAPVVVAVAKAPATATSGALPFTGNNTVLLVEIAAAFLGAGLVLRALGGRRRARASKS